MSSNDDNNEIPGYLNKKIYSDIDIERNLVDKEEPKIRTNNIRFKIRRNNRKFGKCGINFHKDYIYINSMKLI